ncbi:hypothetical protein [Gimesia aquarii]|uniref:Uncharacterized protein n=1 Tax=Gimesia aquarii TaxID=2527964 RepID=A0A517VRL1_9PLAN|nr:hypothetical protein [Gimesia aquarii]QDT95642.1 hypothetical protein V144x_10880 [Gimesia aquarii]
MINLWTLGAVFLFVNFMIGFYILINACEIHYKKATFKKGQDEERQLNISIGDLVVCILIATFFINQYIGVTNFSIWRTGGTESDYIFAEIAPLRSDIDLHTWQRVTYQIGSCLSVSLFAAIYLWLTRCALPEKYKSCITWRKPKDE